MNLDASLVLSLEYIFGASCYTMDKLSLLMIICGLCGGDMVFIINIIIVMDDNLDLKIIVNKGWYLCIVQGESDTVMVTKRFMHRFL